MMKVCGAFHCIATMCNDMFVFCCIFTVEGTGGGNCSCVDLPASLVAPNCDNADDSSDSDSDKEVGGGECCDRCCNEDCEHFNHLDSELCIACAFELENKDDSDVDADDSDEKCIHKNRIFTIKQKKIIVMDNGSVNLP